MDPLAVMLFMAIATFIGIGRYVWAHHRWRAMMQAIADQTGLDATPKWTGIGLDELSGQWSGATVWIKPLRTLPLPRIDGVPALFPRRKGSDHLELEVTLPADPMVAFGPEPPQIMRLVMGRDTETGDTPFDDAVRLTGNPTALRALLDHRTRQAMLAFVTHGGRGEARRLRLVWRHGYDIGRAAECITAARTLAERLRPPGTARARLAAIAREDPIAEVRARVLGLLVGQHAHTAEAATAALALLGDPAPAVRLVAARAAGEAGVAVLDALVGEGGGVGGEGVADATADAKAEPVAGTDAMADAKADAVPDPVRIGAIEALGRTELGRAVLMRRLPALSGLVRSAAVATLRETTTLAGGLAVVGDPAGALSLPPEGVGGLSEA